jgi:hypothetical protein
MGKMWKTTPNVVVRWVKNGEPSSAFSKANIVATIVYEYPLWGSPECKYMHILLTHAEHANKNENFQK